MIKILYIEDDPAVQRAVKRGLERIFEDVAIVVADSAPTAIEILEVTNNEFGCFHFDHIVCDYNLNGTTGADVLLWLLARPDTLTALDGDELKTPRQVYLERFTFLSANPIAMQLHNRYIEKPCTAKTIAAALATKGPIRIFSSFGIG